MKRFFIGIQCMHCLELHGESVIYSCEFLCTIIIIGNQSMHGAVSILYNMWVHYSECLQSEVDCSCYAWGSTVTLKNMHTVLAIVIAIYTLYVGLLINTANCLSIRAAVIPLVAGCIARTTACSTHVNITVSHFTQITATWRYANIPTCPRICIN